MFYFIYRVVFFFYSLYIWSFSEGHECSCLCVCHEVLFRAVLLITYFPCSFLSSFSYISVFSKGTPLIKGIYRLKGHLLNWLTGCGLGGPIVAVSHWRSQEPGSSHVGWCLSCLSLALRARRIPEELLVFGLHWNPQEVSSVIGEGVL